MGKRLPDDEEEEGAIQGYTRRPRLFRKTQDVIAPSHPACSSTAGPGSSSLAALLAKKGARKVTGEVSTAPKVTRKANDMPDELPAATDWLPRKRLRKLEQKLVAAPAADVAEEQPRCRPRRSLSDGSRDEAFRNLFGNVVFVRAPSKYGKQADLIPWRDLEPSDVDQLSCDEVCHYEKLLCLSSKRGRPERVARLLQLAQRNTLPYAAQDPAGLRRQRSSGGISSLAAFLASSDEEQQLVGAAELKRLERLAFLVDNEFLSLGERRDRLVERLREARSRCEPVLKTRTLASLLAAGAAAGVSKGADTEMVDAAVVASAGVAAAEKSSFAVGQQVQRRDRGEEWGIGYVTSVDPLQVTVFGDASARGHEWDEVRQIPPEVPSSPSSQ